MTHFYSGGHDLGYCQKYLRKGKKKKKDGWNIFPSFHAGQKVKWDKVLSSQSLAASKCAQPAHCGDGSLETHEWFLLSIRGTKLPALGNAIYAQMPVQIQLSYTLNVCYTVCDT